MHSFLSHVYDDKLFCCPPSVCLCLCTLALVNANPYLCVIYSLQSSALSGVTIDSEPSSFSDVLQDPVSIEDAMDDFEDKPTNDNMFVSLENENPNNPNCELIGPNTCDRRIACEWICESKTREDRFFGCCQPRNQSWTSFPTMTPTPRPNRRPTRRPTPRPTPAPTRRPTGDFDDGLDEGRSQAMSIWRNLGNSCSSA